MVTLRVNLMSAPNETDIRITRDLVRAGQLLKIEVLDHLLGQPNHGCETKIFRV